VTKVVLDDVATAIDLYKKAVSVLLQALSESKIPEHLNEAIRHQADGYLKRVEVSD